jgi:hypothetical protein
MLRAELLGEPREHGWFGHFEPKNQAILGRCRCWGTVLEGEGGWRTKFAALDALIDIGQQLDLGSPASGYDVLPVAVPVDLAPSFIGTLTARPTQLVQATELRSR